MEVVEAGYQLWQERALAMPYGKVATPRQNRQMHALPIRKILIQIYFI
jgi:hypothetical protein